MFSINPIGPKIVSSLKKGKINAKKMALPQEVSLVPVSAKKASNKAKAGFSSCGSIEVACTPLLSF